MKSAGKARSNGLYRHIRTSKEIIRNLLNDYCITVLKNYKNELDRTKASANTPVSGSAEFAVQMIGPYKIKRKPDSQSMPKMFFLYRHIFYINAAQCSTWFILYKIKYKIL